MRDEEQRIFVFCSLFFLITLLPFLGLGNITSRYSYLSSVGFVLLLVFLGKKLYDYLLKINDRFSASSVMIILICLFSLIHLIQIQKGEKDWFEAGEKTKRFLISIDSFYSDYWTKERIKVYFVNVPIRQGDAWVFPAGLKDVLWFVFHNDNLIVNQVSSVDEALNAIEGLPNEKVFEFDDKGGLTERRKCQDPQCLP